MERQKKRFVVRPRPLLEPMIRLLRWGFVAAAALLFVARICAQSSTVGTPEANPSRLTVSTPATLTPVGYLQFENGGLYSEASREFTMLYGIINQVTNHSCIWLSDAGPIGATYSSKWTYRRRSLRQSARRGLRRISSNRIARGGPQTYRNPQLHSPSLRESRART